MPIYTLGVRTVHVGSKRSLRVNSSLGENGSEKYHGGTLQDFNIDPTDQNTQQYTSSGELDNYTYFDENDSHRSNITTNASSASNNSLSSDSLKDYSATNQDSPSLDMNGEFHWTSFSRNNESNESEPSFNQNLNSTELKVDSEKSNSISSENQLLNNSNPETVGSTIGETQNNSSAAIINSEVVEALANDPSSLNRVDSFSKLHELIQGLISLDKSITMIQDSFYKSNQSAESKLLADVSQLSNNTLNGFVKTDVANESFPINETTTKNEEIFSSPDNDMSIEKKKNQSDYIKPVEQKRQTKVFLNVADLVSHCLGYWNDKDKSDKAAHRRDNIFPITGPARLRTSVGDIGLSCRGVENLGGPVYEDYGSDMDIVKALSNSKPKKTIDVQATTNSLPNSTMSNDSLPQITPSGVPGNIYSLDETTNKKVRHILKQMMDIDDTVSFFYTKHNISSVKTDQQGVNINQNLNNVSSVKTGQLTVDINQNTNNVSSVKTGQLTVDKNQNTNDEISLKSDPPIVDIIQKSTHVGNVNAGTINIGNDSKSDNSTQRNSIGYSRSEPPSSINQLKKDGVVKVKTPPTIILPRMSDDTKYVVSYLNNTITSDELKALDNNTSDTKTLDELDSLMLPADFEDIEDDQRIYNETRVKAIIGINNQTQLKTQLKEDIYNLSDDNKDDAKDDTINDIKDNDIDLPQDFESDEDETPSTSNSTYPDNGNDIEREYSNETANQENKPNSTKDIDNKTILTNASTSKILNETKAENNQSTEIVDVMTVKTQINATGKIRNMTKAREATTPIGTNAHGYELANDFVSHGYLENKSIPTKHISRSSNNTVNDHAFLLKLDSGPGNVFDDDFPRTEEEKMETTAAKSKQLHYKKKSSKNHHSHKRRNITLSSTSNRIQVKNDYDYLEYLDKLANSGEAFIHQQLGDNVIRRFVGKNKKKGLNLKQYIKDLRKHQVRKTGIVDPSNFSVTFGVVKKKFNNSDELNLFPVDEITGNEAHIRNLDNLVNVYRSIHEAPKNYRLEELLNGRAGVASNDSESKVEGKVNIDLKARDEDEEEKVTENLLQEFKNLTIPKYIIHDTSNDTEKADLTPKMSMLDTFFNLTAKTNNSQSTGHQSSFQKSTQLSDIYSSKSNASDIEKLIRKVVDERISEMQKKKGSLNNHIKQSKGISNDLHNRNPDENDGVDDFDDEDDDGPDEDNEDENSEKDDDHREEANLKKNGDQEEETIENKIEAHYGGKESPAHENNHERKIIQEDNDDDEEGNYGNDENEDEDDDGDNDELIAENTKLNMKHDARHDINNNRRPEEESIEQKVQQIYNNNLRNENNAILKEQEDQIHNQFPSSLQGNQVYNSVQGNQYHNSLPGNQVYNSVVQENGFHNSIQATQFPNSIRGNHFQDSFQGNDVEDDIDEKLLNPQQSSIAHIANIPVQKQPYQINIYDYESENVNKHRIALANQTTESLMESKQKNSPIVQKHKVDKIASTDRKINGLHHTGQLVKYYKMHDNPINAFTKHTKNYRHKHVLKKSHLSEISFQDTGIFKHHKMRKTKKGKTSSKTMKRTGKHQTGTKAILEDITAQLNKEPSLGGIATKDMVKSAVDEGNNVLKNLYESSHMRSEYPDESTESLIGSDKSQDNTNAIDSSDNLPDESESTMDELEDEDSPENGAEIESSDTPDDNRDNSDDQIV